MELSIIIVNWNTGKLLEKCLASILKYGQGVEWELIVIDNNSSDGSQEIIKQFSNLGVNPFKIILNNYNFGFAKAVNQGIKISAGKYVLLLNPDTEIKEETLKKIVEFMDKHPKVGIVGGKILNPSGTVQASVRCFPTIVSQALILLKLHHFFNLPALKKYFALDFDYAKTQEVDQVMGAFFLIRKEIIGKVGLFDEKFFLWFEEVDFCKRIKMAGWKIIYYPEAEIIHYGAASFSQNPSLKNQHQFNKSLLYYFKKHHNFLEYITLLFFIPPNLLLTIVASLLQFFKKNKENIIE